MLEAALLTSCMFVGFLSSCAKIQLDSNIYICYTALVVRVLRIPSPIIHIFAFFQQFASHDLILLVRTRSGRAVVYLYTTCTCGCPYMDIPIVKLHYCTLIQHITPSKLYFIPHSVHTIVSSQLKRSSASARNTRYNTPYTTCHTTLTT